MNLSLPASSVHTSELAFKASSVHLGTRYAEQTDSRRGIPGQAGKYVSASRRGWRERAGRVPGSIHPYSRGAHSASAKPEKRLSERLPGRGTAVKRVRLRFACGETVGDGDERGIPRGERWRRIRYYLLASACFEDIWISEI